MKYIDEFRNLHLVQKLAEYILQELAFPVKLMEVCGTHTMAIARFGIRELLPSSITLVSGPGCPVCVTPQSQIDELIRLGRQKDVILATFGDLLRVPGTLSSLELERAKGADIRVVYSPLDAVEIAVVNKDKRVVFAGIGFETTAPGVALAVLEAKKRGLTNFYVLSAHKLIPPAMSALASDPAIAIQGFICPGHVSTVIGISAYLPLVREYKIPCVISGFEPLDILQSILMLVRQIKEGRADVEVQYSRAVSQEGNLEAKRCIDKVFKVADAEWRGLGVIPSSGLEFKPEFSMFDAKQFLSERSATLGDEKETICKCGWILKGLISPRECSAFGTKCTPNSPLGPCMVSSEGACAAEYRYSRLTSTNSRLDDLRIKGDV